MTGYLTTHVLDTSKGKPAAGLEIILYRVSGNSHRKIATAVTNSDGRTDGPILPEKDFKTGEYELIFKCGDYLEDTSFLNDIPIRFTMSEEDHYHVPLLLSPFGFSTYRGS
jgi:5-hydroxyisourate hydrolase